MIPADESDLLGNWPDEWLPDEEPPQPVAWLPMILAAVSLVTLMLIILSLLGALSWSAR